MALRLSPYAEQWESKRCIQSCIGGGKVNGTDTSVPFRLAKTESLFDYCCRACVIDFLGMGIMYVLLILSPVIFMPSLYSPLVYIYTSTCTCEQLVNTHGVD